MKPVYMCEYCDEMGDKTTIEEHEIVCARNPANKACFSCKHARVVDCANIYCEVTCNGFVDGTGAKTCWEKGEPKRVWTIY